MAAASTKELAGFVPENANVGLSYIRRGITVRINYSYSGRRLQSYNATQSLLVYQLAAKTVNIRTVFRATKHFDVYFDVNNVFNQPSFVRVFYGGRPNTMSVLSPQVLFGINGRL